MVNFLGHGYWKFIANFQNEFWEVVLLILEKGQGQVDSNRGY